MTAAHDTATVLVLSVIAVVELLIIWRQWWTGAVREQARVELERQLTDTPPDDIKLLQKRNRRLNEENEQLRNGELPLANSASDCEQLRRANSELWRIKNVQDGDLRILKDALQEATEPKPKRSRARKT